MVQWLRKKEKKKRNEETTSSKPDILPHHGGKLSDCVVNSCLAVELRVVEIEWHVLKGLRSKMKGRRRRRIERQRQSLVG